ncbi:MAG: tetratricopeptide repeat protein [Byssovorax sp.]
MSARRSLCSPPAIVATAAFAAAIALAGAARADKPSSTERQARALFDQGVALSDEGKWAEALAVFQKSDELVPSASAEFNIGATLRALGRYVEARRVLVSTLDQASSQKPLKPALKKEIEKILGEVKEKIVTLTLRLNPAGAGVQVDGVKAALSSTGQIELDPGKHVFVIEAAGYDTTTVNKTISSADTELALTAPKTKSAEPPPPPKQAIYQKAWFWTTIGIVVTGGAAVGVVMAVRPRGEEPASPPTSTVDRVIPTSAGFRF